MTVASKRIAMVLPVFIDRQYYQSRAVPRAEKECDFLGVRISSQFLKRWGTRKRGEREALSVAAGEGGVRADVTTALLLIFKNSIKMRTFWGDCARPLEGVTYDASTLDLKLAH
jgi:hypothetical protein